MLWIVEYRYSTNEAWRQLTAHAHESHAKQCASRHMLNVQCETRVRESAEFKPSPRPVEV